MMFRKPLMLILPAFMRVLTAGAFSSVSCPDRTHRTQSGVSCCCGVMQIARTDTIMSGR